jgi:hypothetical protein
MQLHLTRLKVRTILVMLIGAQWMLVNTEQGFIVSVSYFPKPPAGTIEDAGEEDAGQTVVGTGSNVYRRMIAFENKEKRVEITGGSHSLGSVTQLIPCDARLQTQNFTL